LKFLQRLWGKSVPSCILSGRILGPGTFAMEVKEVAIENLDAYWKATSNEWQRQDEERDFYERKSDARLVSDTASHLPHAIRVEIAKKRVGQVTHADALRMRRRLNDLGYDGIDCLCDAKLVGREGFWEIKLDVDPALPRAKPAASTT